MSYFRPSDPGKSEGADIHWLWYVGMIAIMFWLILTEPQNVTGHSHESKRIHLDHLPWNWSPAVLAWLAYSAAFRVCCLENIEEWSDLDSETLGQLALGVLWRVLIWSALVVGSILICAKFGWTYDAVTWLVIAAVILNAIVGVLRKPPESLWD